MTHVRNSWADGRPLEDLGIRSSDRSLDFLRFWDWSFWERAGKIIDVRSRYPGRSRLDQDVLELGLLVPKDDPGPVCHFGHLNWGHVRSTQSSSRSVEPCSAYKLTDKIQTSAELAIFEFFAEV